MSECLHEIFCILCSFRDLAILWLCVTNLLGHAYHRNGILKKTKLHFTLLFTTVYSDLCSVFFLLFSVAFSHWLRIKHILEISMAYISEGYCSQVTWLLFWISWEPVITADWVWNTNFLPHSRLYWKHYWKHMLNKWYCYLVLKSEQIK